MTKSIKSISVKQLFHLRDFQIKLPKGCEHLIITGRNGSGKTILLRALADFLELVKNDSDLNFLNYEKFMAFDREQLAQCTDSVEKERLQKRLEYRRRQYDLFFGKVFAEFEDVADFSRRVRADDFMLAYYAAERTAHMKEVKDVKNPSKPVLGSTRKIGEQRIDQFLYFLSDLKIQEALARNERQDKDADEIKTWFLDFERILREIYQDAELRLEFNFRDYSFKIKTKGKTFKFTEMSDGYIAAIDIIADLILKMQSSSSLTRDYKKSGLVLIDEIETHLHLELQRLVLPLLTKIFPNIQFIVTTHSPFVLSSLKNAAAYDLESREIIEDLTEYSYESLAEGYFDVRTESSYMRTRLETMELLLKKDVLSDGEKDTLCNLIESFEKIPEPVSPMLVGMFRQLCIKYSAKIRGLREVL